MGKLDGKVALVTGSGRGIGRAIAMKLASEGARIVVNDLDADPAHETVEAAEEDAARKQWPAWATSARRTSPIASSTRRSSAYKGIDIIVNNAGLHVGRRDPEDDRRAVVRASSTAT